MSPDSFPGMVLGWHDFYVATAGATAALLGLLFVGVSINLAALAADERVDLRARTGQAFANLVFVLIIALIMLIPDPDPGTLAASLAVVAAFGGFRVGQNLFRIYRERRQLRNPWPTLRRIGWTVTADVVLLFTAWRIWESAGHAAVLGNLVVVVLVLMLGAADIAWEVLTEVSAEA
jgi:modulator of FtsH protease